MKIAPFPADEDLRVKDLLSYDILDTSNEKDFDGLVELASQLCNCPVALITFINTDRQWFKARKGLDDKETTRDMAICAHTILQNEVLVVDDARKDERFFDYPSVTGDMQVVFYAGAPIVSSAGHNLGSVCVIDRSPKKEFTDKQKAALEMISQQVSKLLELRAKNKMLIRHAEAQIAAEKRLTQLAVKEHDRHSSNVAFELHENLVQSLAATKLFFESSMQTKDMASYFFRKGMESLSLVIGEVKELSKSIVPTTFQNADYFDVIQDFALRFCKHYGIAVEFSEPTIIRNGELNIGFNLYRIVQYQLEVSKNCGAKNISVSIVAGNPTTLAIKDDGYNDNKTEANNTLFRHIITRAELMDGEVEYNSATNSNTLIVTIPTSVSQQ